MNQLSHTTSVVQNGYGDDIQSQCAVRLTKTNVLVGPIPLLTRTLFGVRPRPLKEILEIFDVGGQAIINFATRYKKLQALADALNENDFSKAAMLFAHLQLPKHLPNEITQFLLLVEHCTKANFDPSEPRDEKGRWTADGNEPNKATDADRAFEVLDTDCIQVLAACRVECTDAYVDGTVRNFFDMRKCLRTCMNRNGCYDF
jgi:hypothetical protein